MFMDIYQSFKTLYREIAERKTAFFIVFFFVVLISYAILFVIDFIPEPVAETETTEKTAVAIVEPELVPREEVVEPVVEDVVVDPLPVSIYFDTLDKEVPVLNPASRSIVDLDEALLSGAVRHPDSATFSEDGNIFILAHSSYLPNVLNKNFQAFNGIQSLTWGDTIRLESGDTEYVYRVQKVYEAKASEVFVPDTPGEAKLTLATCNSFGSKDDRYMVEADLVSSRTIQ